MLYALNDSRSERLVKLFFYLDLQVHLGFIVPDNRHWGILCTRQPDHG
jgi:hypothetical protein